jgi:hypothetical protein
MMNPPTAVLAALIAAASVSVARPGLAQKSYALGISGGVAIPTGVFADSTATGFGVTGFIALGVPDLPIGVRFDGVYNKFQGRDFPSVGGAGRRTPDMQVMGFLGSLIYSFSGTTAKPYLITGGGIYNTKADVAGAKSENDFGFTAGFGATFGVRSVAGFIEARYHGISRNEEDGGAIQFVPITLGIMF